jgi:hypothetical protein
MPRRRAECSQFVRSSDAAHLERAILGTIRLVFTTSRTQKSAAGRKVRRGFGGRFEIVNRWLRQTGKGPATALGGSRRQVPESPTESGRHSRRRGPTRPRRQLPAPRGRSGGCLRDLIQVKVQIRADNAPAIALHKKIGFVRESVTRDAFLVDDDYCDGLPWPLSTGPANLFPSTAPVPSLDGSRPQAHPRVSPHWPILIRRLRSINSRESDTLRSCLLSSDRGCPDLRQVELVRRIRAGVTTWDFENGFAVALFLRTIYGWLPAITRVLQERRDQYSEKMR